MFARVRVKKDRETVKEIVITKEAAARALASEVDATVEKVQEGVFVVKFKEEKEFVGEAFGYEVIKIDEKLYLAVCRGNAFLFDLPSPL